MMQDILSNTISLKWIFRCLHDVYLINHYKFNGTLNLLSTELVAGNELQLVLTRFQLPGLDLRSRR